MRDLTALIFTMFLLACGGSKSSGVELTEQAQAREDAVPPLQCDTFTARIDVCLEEFIPVYARTSLAHSAGEGDGEKGAKMFESVVRKDHDQAAQIAFLCDTAWGIQHKDARWREKWHGCFEQESCEAWAECFAPLVGRGFEGE